MNAADGRCSEQPVENVFWKCAPEGEYEVRVKFYKARFSSPVKYTVHVNNNGKLRTYHDGLPWPYKARDSNRKETATIIIMKCLARA